MRLFLLFNNIVFLLCMICEELKRPWKKEECFSRTFTGEHNETKQKVSVFVFDKSDLNNYSEEEREKILNFLRKESDTLKKAKNQHKNFLNIIQPLTEDSSKLIFITEKISYNIKTWVKKIMI